MHEIFYLGKEVSVEIDRPLGSAHPDGEFIYPLNYGFIPGTVSGDGDPIDVYVLDSKQAQSTAQGQVIGMIIRKNDVENKLILSVENRRYSTEDLIKFTHFQEQYFQTEYISLVAFEEALQNQVGLPKGSVVLAGPYRSWDYIFHYEAAQIEHQIGYWITELHHTGSTSIPNLKAKPIIDILIGVPGWDELDKIVVAMQSLGYTYKGENGIPGRQYFTKGDPRSFHVHMCKTDNQQYRKQLIFKQRLCANPNLVTEYEDLKMKLSKKYKDDRESYTTGKNDFIQSVIR